MWRHRKATERNATWGVKALDRDLINIDVRVFSFGVRVPLRVDFQKMNISPYMAQGVFDINLPESLEPIDSSEGKTIKLYAEHNGNSKEQSIVASEIKKVEFVSSYCRCSIGKGE